MEIHQHMKQNYLRARREGMQAGSGSVAALILNLGTKGDE